MTRNRRMTAAEFDTVRPMLGLSEDRIGAARAIMVDGETYRGTADRYGWKSPSTPYECVEVVWKTFEKYQEGQVAHARSKTLMPPGWEEVTIIAPTALVARFRKEIAEAAAAWNQALAAQAREAQPQAAKKRAK